MIREFTIRDLAALEDHAIFPNHLITSPDTIIKSSIYSSNEQLVASFFVRKTTELFSVYHPEATRRECTLGTLEMIEFLTEEIKKLGFSDVHAFIKGQPSYAAFLMRRVGMTEVEDQVLHRYL